jgi:hypothetical protein
VTVAGMLFATASCVDNTESESVSALRNAKAAELNANADYLKAQAAVAQTLATAQAALLNAQAATEASVAKYNEALAAQAIAQGEADKLLAEADNIRAEADKLIAEGKKAESLGLAEQYVAESVRLKSLANQIDTEAKIKADSAAEALRGVKAKNDLLLATLELDIQKAQVRAQTALLRQQQYYLKQVNIFEAAYVQDYIDAVDNLTSVQDSINDLEAENALKEVKIKKTELELATYSIDSLRFVEDYIQETKNLKTTTGYDLKKAQMRKEFWESYDVHDSDWWEKYEEGLVQDTAIAKEKWLYAAETGLDSVKAIVTEKTEAAVEAKKQHDKDSVDYDVATDAYEAAVAKYDDAVAKVNKAKEDLKNYNAIASGEGFVPTPYSDNDPAPFSGYGEVLPYTFKFDETTTSPAYTKLLLEQKVTPYDYGSFKLYLYNDEIKDVPVDISLYIFDDGSYWWTADIYEYAEADEANYDKKYPTVSALLYDINEAKYEENNITDILNDNSEKLKNTIDSVKKYADSASYYQHGVGKSKIDDANKDKEKALVEQATALEKYDIAETAYTNGKAAFIASTKGPADSLVFNNLAKAYNWTILDPLGTPDADGLAFKSAGPANNDNSALKVLQNVDDKIADLDLLIGTFEGRGSNYFDIFGDFKAELKTLINLVITGNQDLAVQKAKVNRLESYKIILDGGTREKLQSALDVAVSALEGPAAAYLKADEVYKEKTDAYADNTDYADAKQALADAEIGLETYKDKILSLEYAFKKSQRIYNKEKIRIDYMVSIGGDEQRLIKKANILHAIETEIRMLEAELAYIDLKLNDAASYAPDKNLGKFVAQVIQKYKEDIETLTKEIATNKVVIEKLRVEEKLYQAALDALVNAYASLNE